MIYRLFLCVMLVMCLTISVAAQDEEPKNILNLPAFGFLTYPENWTPLWDHPYAPAVQSEDGAITVRLQSGDTLESPLTVVSVGDDALKVLESLDLDLLSEPREIVFGDEESILLEGIVVETKLNEDTNRLLVLALPTYQENWYLITLDAPASDWKAFLLLADSILKTFQYIPNAPLLRVVLGYDLPEGAVLRRHEMETLEVISQRLYDLDLGTPFTAHLLADQTVEIGFYGGIQSVADVAAWVSQVGFFELVDFSDIESPALLSNTLILTTGRLTWQAANQPASGPSASPDEEDLQLHPVTNAPFESVLTSADFTGASTNEPTETLQWEFEARIAEMSQDTLKTFTQNNIGGAMAIVVDGKVILTPIIQAEVSESLVLTGNFTEEEVRQLTAIVNSGPLPVPMVVATIELLE